MKKLTLPASFLIISLLTGCARRDSLTAADAQPAYISESALPVGWPVPGPYNQVTFKNYPAYRAAFTTSGSPNGGFWTLFKHIKRHNIPMTSPVEMTMKDDPSSVLKMEQMGFLYQSPAVGKTGADGDSVAVQDFPALRVLSYTWQGPRDEEQIALAKKAIEAQLQEKKLTTSGFRVYGYNSPSVSRNKQTYELQAILR